MSCHVKRLAHKIAANRKRLYYRNYCLYFFQVKKQVEKSSLKNHNILHFFLDITWKGALKILPFTFYFWEDLGARTSLDNGLKNPYRANACYGLP